MHKPTVAVVGVGHLGSRHAQIYKEIENCTLVAVCDIDKDRLARVSGELQVPGFADYKELLDKADVVSIATPTKTHFKIAYDFLKANIHTLVEKPFTTNLKEADALIKEAQKNKLILQVGHVERFNSAFAATAKLLKNPKFIECHRLSPFPNRSLDIGVVLDLMIHDVDIVLGLVNSSIKKVEAVGVPVLSKLEDIANARLTFKNGCVCNLTASRVSDEWMRKIRIFLENAYISLDYKNEEAFIYKKTPLGITKDALPIEKEQPLKKELVSFIDCVIQNKAPLVSGEIAKEALALALRIQKLIWKKPNIS
jgi:predicted dehydrogenase